jgi:hypothetical protein
LTERERTAIETYRDACAALALIREAAEDCALPGSLSREDYLTADFQRKQRPWSAASTHRRTDGLAAPRARLPESGLTQDAGEIRTGPQSMTAVACRVDVV